MERPRGAAPVAASRKPELLPGTGAAGRRPELLPTAGGMPHGAGGGEGVAGADTVRVC